MNILVLSFSCSPLPNRKTNVTLSKLLQTNNCLQILVFVMQNSGPQPFWHQGLVSWKTIFPRMGGVGVGWGLDMTVQAVM